MLGRIRPDCSTRTVRVRVPLDYVQNQRWKVEGALSGAAEVPQQRGRRSAVENARVDIRGVRRKPCNDPPTSEPVEIFYTLISIFR